MLIAGKILFYCLILLSSGKNKDLYIILWMLQIFPCYRFGIEPLLNFLNLNDDTNSSRWHETTFSLSLSLFQISNNLHHLYLKGRLPSSLAFRSLTESFGKHCERESDLSYILCFRKCKKKMYTPHKILFVFLSPDIILTSTWETFN